MPGMPGGPRPAAGRPAAGGLPDAQAAIWALAVELERRHHITRMYARASPAAGVLSVCLGRSDRPSTGPPRIAAPPHRPGASVRQPFRIMGIARADSDDPPPGGTGVHTHKNGIGGRRMWRCSAPADAGEPRGRTAGAGDTGP